MKTFFFIFLSISHFMTLFLAAEASHYQLINLGLCKFQTSEATSLNNQGQVCGTYCKREKSYLYVWDPIKKMNYTRMRASAKPVINNRGDIFGSQWHWSSDGFWEFDQETIFCWKNPLSYFTFFNIKNLHFPEDPFKLSAILQERRVVWDANDYGQLVIMNTHFIKDFFPAGPWGHDYKVWVYDKGRYQEICHDQFLVGLKINNRSQVLGSFCEEQSSFPKSYTVMTSIYDIKKGTTRVLDFPFSTFGKDFNDEGQVVGVFYDALTHAMCGFMGTPSHYLVIEHFNPHAVNNHNHIIGKFLNGEKKDKPAIWKEGQLYDLLDIVDLVDDQGQVWDSLDELVDINDRGEIVGQGKFQGASHGFLLRPLPTS